MTILRIYVAAVCLASVLFGLYDAPRFLRARQKAGNANLSRKNSYELMEKASAKSRAQAAAGQNTADSEAEWMRWSSLWTTAVETSQKADDVYEVQRMYGAILGSILGGHLALLGACEYWIHRRENRPVTDPTSN